MIEHKMHKYLTKYQQNLLLLTTCASCLYLLINSFASLGVLSLFLICFYKLIQLNEIGFFMVATCSSGVSSCLIPSLQEKLINQEKDKEEYIKKSLLDHHPIGILICKIKFETVKIVYLNKHVQDIFNLDTNVFDDDLIVNELKKFEKCLVKKVNFKSKKTNTLFHNIIDTSSNNKFINISKYNDGEKIILVNSSNLFIKENLDSNASDNQCIYKLVSIENLSEERKNMLNSLYKNIRSQFFNTISHELNNPLSGLLHYVSKLISNEYISNSKKEKHLIKIRQFKFLIKFFIKNLTLYSKLMLKEKINLNPINVSLGHLMMSILSKFKSLFDSKKIKYNSDLENSYNLVLLFDYDYLKFFLKNVFMYVCYKIKDNKNFKVQSVVLKEKKLVKFNFFKQNSNKIIYQYLPYPKKEIESLYNESMNVEDSVKTEEMLRDIIDTLSKFLKIKLTHSPFKKLFLSFECNYSDLENNSEWDDMEEFSVDSFSNKVLNVQKVPRSIQLETSLFGTNSISKKTLNTIENTCKSDFQPVHKKFLITIPTKKKSSKCDFDLDNENGSTIRKNFFSLESLKKEIDETGILKLKQYLNYHKDPLKTISKLETNEINDKLININPTDNSKHSKENILHFSYKIAFGSGGENNIGLDTVNINTNSKNENKNNNYINSISNRKINMIRASPTKKRVKKNNYKASEKNFCYKNEEQNNQLSLFNYGDAYYKDFKKNNNVKKINNLAIDVIETESDYNNNTKKRRIHTDLITSHRIRDLLLTPLDDYRSCRSNIYRPTDIIENVLNNYNRNTIWRKMYKRSEVRDYSLKKDDKNVKLPLTPLIRSNSINCNCKRILIVDDESFNINTMKHNLKSYKIFPDFCFNGKEAVEKVLSNVHKTCCDANYKVIFMDIMMPVLDGIEASQQIQKICEKYEIQDMSIIIISAHDSDLIYQRVKGIDLVKEFTNKPMKKSKIDELLNKYYFDIDLK